MTIVEPATIDAVCAALARRHVTVVRLPLPDGHGPLERVLTTVARVDLALADRLHAATDAEPRPFAVSRRRDTLDVVAFDDALARALLAGEPQARIVVRFTADRFLATPPGPPIRVGFLTPTHFRVIGLDHLLPDPVALFHSLQVRWEALGWPSLPWPPYHLLAAWPHVYRRATMPTTVGDLPGFTGVVSYLYRRDRICGEQERALWALARFGEYRGVGKHTTYGMGRIRLLPDHTRLEPGDTRSAWEV